VTKVQRQHGMAVNFGILYGRPKEPNMSERKYNLTLTEEHAGILVAALDLYARIGIGQFEVVAEVYDPGRNLEARDAIHTLLLAAKEEAGHPRNGSHGIHNSKVDDRFRASFDLKQVIQNRVAWDKNPKGGIQVQYDEPNRTAETFPLATIEKVVDQALGPELLGPEFSDPK
jgi:hypothetical protein